MTSQNMLIQIIQLLLVELVDLKDCFPVRSFCPLPQGHRDHRYQMHIYIYIWVPLDIYKRPTRFLKAKGWTIDGHATQEDMLYFILHGLGMNSKTFSQSKQLT